MSLRISRYISAIVISLLLITPVRAQENAEEPHEKTEKEKEAELAKQEIPVFMGVIVQADIVGVVMKALDADWSQMEVAARLNFKEKFFPVFELGYGESDCIGTETENTFSTKAPYFRVGMDYNFSKKWWNGNRIYAGFRYAFTSFDYDIAALDFADPVWGNDVTFNYEGLSANSHWAELVFGLETKIWGIFYLGWNVRYKFRIKHSEATVGKPYYVPGFGEYDNSCFGGTFNIIFNI